MIIDFRSRPPYKSFATNTQLFPRLTEADFESPMAVPALNMGNADMESARQGSMPLYMDEMKRAGIDIAVVAGRKTTTEGYVDNADIYQLTQDYKGKFFAFAGLDLADIPAAVEDLENCVRQYGFIGASIEPGYAGLYADDPCLFPLYEACQRLGIMVCLTQSVYVGPDVSYSEPVHVQRVAQRYTDLTFLIDHGCWPHVQAALGMAMVCPNVYLVPDFYCYIPGMPMAEEFVKAANYYLKYRMLFASGYPIRGQGQSVQQFTALPFKEDVLPQLLYKNALRLLKLEDTEPAGR